MDRYVARANIDHFIALLNHDGLPPQRRVVVSKLLIEEEDKLSHNLEQLEFAETRAAKGRDALNRMREKLGNCRPESRAELERLVQNFEALQQMLDGFCHRVRAETTSQNSRQLGSY